MSIVLKGFSALNREAETSEDTRIVDKPSDHSEDSEEQILDPSTLLDHCLVIYNKALSQYGSKKYSDAADTFKEVLESRYISHKSMKHLDTSRKIRYNSLKYLGLCLGQENKHEEALPLLLAAYKLDPDDVNLSVKLGMFAIKLGGHRLPLARSAFENVLRLSPNHWQCLDLVVQLTFRLRDFTACLMYLDQALRKNPDYTKGIQLRRAILKEVPGFRPLCPDGNHIRDDLELPEIKWDFPLNMVRQTKDEDDYYTIKVGDINFAAFLNLLVKEHKKLRDRNLAPLFVSLEYVQTKIPPIEVSIQNVVQEMIDIVTATPESEAISEQIIEGIIDETLRRSNKFLMSTIIHEIIDSVVDKGKPPSSSRHSFLQEVPYDLLEIRRSSRVKGSDATSYEDSNKYEEMSVRATLESFIPTSLSKNVEEKQKPSKHERHGKEARKSLKRKHRNFSIEHESNTQDSSDQHDSNIFPSDTKQNNQIKELVNACPKACVEEIIYKILLYLVKMKPMHWPEELQKAFVRAYHIWRDSFVLPNELDPKTHMEYIKVMILADEILVSLMKNKNLTSDSLMEFLEDDFLHFRLSFPKFSESQLIRSVLAEHQYSLEKKRNNDALYHGKALLSLVRDYLEAETPGSEEIRLDEWIITGTTLDPKSLDKTLSFLQHSKILHKVQEFFDNQNYKKVNDILSQTIDMDKKDNEDETWLMRLFMLIESLWQLNDFSGCLERSALALEKVVSLCCGQEKDENNLDEEARSIHITDISNLISTIENSLKMLDDEKKRFSQSATASICKSLVSIMSGQVNGTLALRSIKPWMLFYHILEHEEQYQSDEVKNDEHGIQHSVHFLVSAHDYLGQLSLCTENQGEFLICLIRALTPLSREKELPNFISDSIKKNLEQAMYCLYSHPSKKSKAKHLVDHGVSAMALTWDKCEFLMKVVLPHKIPEFDDFKSLSISSDVEALLKRFTALVPDEFDLQSRQKQIHDYFYNSQEENESLPRFKNNKKFPKAMRDMFYLLGDFNFKNSNFKQSIPFLLQDISFNRHRLDSFFELALACANLVETKISATYSENISEILKESEAVLKMFKMCTRRTAKNPTIYIEGASFAFVMNAFCSRVIKSEASSNFSLEEFSNFEKKKSNLLKLAEKWFGKAVEIFDAKLEEKEGNHKEAIEDKEKGEGEEGEEHVDERWLVHFFRGKVMEKLGKSVQDCLKEYLLAMKNLKAQDEYIPFRIVFSNAPTDSSLEFLEMYYRFHASMLKMELQPGFSPTEKLINSLVCLFDELDQIEVFKRQAEKPSLAYNNEDECLTKPKRPKMELTWDCIAEECIKALERVTNTYPHHYKALHLLASYFIGNHKRRDVARAKEYLLYGRKTGATTKSASLFGDRKVSNLFSGIWQNPINELERSGSFPTHMTKCLNVLFEVLRETEDYGVFLEAVVYLKKSADGDKKYLFENDRQNFNKEACSSLLQILNTKTDRFVKKPGFNDESKLKFCLDLYGILRGKKPLPKNTNDQMKLMVKKLYCSIFDKSDGTHDQANSFFAKLSVTDKDETLKKAFASENREKDLVKILEECSNLVRHPDGKWTQKQMIVGKDMASAPMTSTANAMLNSSSMQNLMSLMQKSPAEQMAAWQALMAGSVSGTATSMAEQAQTLAALSMIMTAQQQQQQAMKQQQQVVKHHHQLSKQQQPQNQTKQQQAQKQTVNRSFSTAKSDSGQSSSKSSVNFGASTSLSKPMKANGNNKQKAFKPLLTKGSIKSVKDIVSGNSSISLTKISPAHQDSSSSAPFPTSSSFPHKTGFDTLTSLSPSVSLTPLSSQSATTRASPSASTAKPKLSTSAMKTSTVVFGVGKEVPSTKTILLNKQVEKPKQSSNSDDDIVCLD